MLVEPGEDPERRALDQALLAAVRARIAAGRRAGPDAEALALRALLAETAPEEAAALRALWGRIEAAGGPPLTVWGPAAQLLAADRHGLSTRAAASAEAALAAARAGGRALLDLDGPPWWGRLLAEPALRITAALPDDRHGRPRALQVARETPGPTGDDRTFWVTDSPLPAGRIVEALGREGLAAEALAASGGLKLFMLAGYVQAEDGRLNGAPGGLGGVIGAAPVY